MNVILMKFLFIWFYYWNYVFFDVKCKIINLLNVVVWICFENDLIDFSNKKNVFILYKKFVVFIFFLIILLKKVEKVVKF